MATAVAGGILVFAPSSQNTRVLVAYVFLLFALLVCRTLARNTIQFFREIFSEEEAQPHGHLRRRGTPLQRLTGAIDPQLRYLAMVDRDFDERDYEVLLSLDESIERFDGASASEINRLPCFVLSERDLCCAREGTEGASKVHCPICLEDFEAGVRVRLLPCLHRFHDCCIDRWLEQKAVCPVCKINVLLYGG